MMRTLVLVCAMYAFAALLWLIAHTVVRRSDPRQPRRLRTYEIMEYVGKSSAAFAVGLTVLILLALALRWANLLPNGGR